MTFLKPGPRAKPPKVTTSPKLLRPARLRLPPVLPRGPHLYGRHQPGLGGPGLPPRGFVIGSTSGSEWVLYWAFAKVFQDPPDPRQPPFYGGRRGEWSYQIPFAGGRHLPGGAVIDYTVREPNLLVRLQTFRFHESADAHKQATDVLQRLAYSRYGVVYDVYEQAFIGDASGQAAIVLVKQMLDGTVESDPIPGGTVREVRPGKV